MNRVMSDTNLHVADLVEHPGASRRLAADFALPAEMVLQLVEVRGPVRVEGVLEGIVDGVLLRGEVVADVALSCARCLAPVDDELRVPVAELYSDPTRALTPDDVEAGYEIREGVIDLEVLLRDAVVAGAPTAPRCRPDCRGLCAGCGADLNAADCRCPQDAPDPRWQALAGLRLRADGDGRATVDGRGSPGGRR